MSKGERSGEQAGQLMGPSLPNKNLGNISWGSSDPQLLIFCLFVFPSTWKPVPIIKWVKRRETMLPIRYFPCTDLKAQYELHNHALHAFEQIEGCMRKREVCFKVCVERNSLEYADEFLLFLTIFFGVCWTNWIFIHRSSSDVSEDLPRRL